MVSAIVIVLISAVIIFGALVFFKKRIAMGATSETSQIEAETKAVIAKLAELAHFAPAYASPKQLENITQQLTSTAADLEQEKARLKEVESKLDGAQKNVESKEGQQQELKTAKEEDEVKLRELMAQYQTLSDESIGLEKRLATSMKNLEVVIEESEATAEQKEALNELLATLTEAGSRLRELLTEYQMVNERLGMLNQQFADLEEEYTKLVEQQLGE